MSTPVTAPPGHFHSLRTLQVNIDTGTITTVAGDPTVAGWTGANKQATGADFKLTYPEVVYLDDSDNLYIGDPSVNVIVKVNTTSYATVIAGVAGPSGGTTADGSVIAGKQINYVHALGMDTNGNVMYGEGFKAIRVIDKVTGIVTTISGTLATSGYSGDGGPASAALLNLPGPKFVRDNNNNTYWCEHLNRVLRKMDTYGVISTIAGTAPTAGSTPDGTTASASLLSTPWGIAIDNTKTRLVWANTLGSCSIRTFIIGGTP